MAKRNRKPLELLTPDAARELGRRVVNCPRCRSKIPLGDMADHLVSKTCASKARRIKENNSRSVKIADAQRASFLPGGLPETNHRKH
jgi:hypothetical protein